MCAFGREVTSKQPAADPLLGESLLDPPQSLDLFARRYQSPSRCGSPSLEAPEYLMFGRGATPVRPEGNVTHKLHLSTVDILNLSWFLKLWEQGTKYIRT
jgi:hypothetical protein